MSIIKIEIVTGNQACVVLTLPPDNPENEGRIHYGSAGDNITFGKFEHYQFQGHGFRIWELGYETVKDAKFNVVVEDRKTLGLAFGLKGNLPYEINGAIKGIALENHFNMLYARLNSIEYSSRGGEKYVILGVEYELWWLEERGLLPHPLSHLVEQAKAGIPSKLSEADPVMTGEIKAITGILSKAFSDRTMVTSLELHSHVTKLPVLCNRQAAVSANPKAALIQRIHDTIIDRLAKDDKRVKDLYAQQIAEEFHISETALREGFIEQFDISAANFITREKMKRAHQLLQESTLSVKEIATAVGYATPNSFSDAYRDFAGLRPRIARKQMNNRKKK